MGAIRDAHTQEFGFSQWLHSISGLDSPQPRGRRRPPGPSAPPLGAPRAPHGLLPPAAPRRRRAAAAAGPGSRAPPPTPGGRGRSARGGELGARRGEAAGDGMGGDGGGGSLSKRRWRRRCPACSRLPGPRSARCISPPSPGSVCRAIALDFGFLQTYQYRRNVLINAKGSFGGGSRRPARGAPTPPSTCLSPIPGIAYLKKKLIVCNAFFFFCNRSTHNTCLGLPPLLRQLSFASEGSSPQLELCRLAGRRAYGSRPEDGW